jgi:hypothetical protein
LALEKAIYLSLAGEAMGLGWCFGKGNQPKLLDWRKPMKAIEVVCPVCRAKPGEQCHAIGGKQLPESHFKRKLAALSDELQHKGNGNRAVTSA